MKNSINFLVSLLLLIGVFGCKNSGSNKNGALGSNAASKVYVNPGELDEYYAFI